MSALTDRFDAVCERLSKAIDSAGRNRDEVKLVAVSKNHPAEAVAELARHWHASGTPVFGESYVQEALPKQDAIGLPSCGIPVEWHFVGHIQSRKAKDIAGRFSLIHSVDSLKLAAALQKAWLHTVAGAPVALDAPEPQPQDILVQVNVGREEQKSGVMPEELEELLTGMLAMPELRVAGLMCLPPIQEIGEHSRPYFTLLRELRDSMQARLGIALPELSMGMSDDFETAIEEGATLVRIGTDIFGPRQY